MLLLNINTHQRDFINNYSRILIKSLLGKRIKRNLIHPVFLSALFQKIL